MKKLFLLMALFGVLCAGCSEPNDPIDTPQDPTEQPGNDTGNGDEGNEDENGGNNDENEGNEDENKTFITDADGNIIVNAEGGEVVVAVATNIDYDVVIPEEAQAWLSVADTRGELRMEKLTFTVAENDFEERSANVELVDSAGKSLQTIKFTQRAFEKVFESNGEGSYVVEAKGGDIQVNVTTNIEYSVNIPDDAQAWLSVADTRAVRNEKLTFTVAENYAEERSAVVTLLDGDKKELQSIVFSQKGAIIDTTQTIKFQDENTKLICALHWDENEDGELSYEEAAKVTDLGTAFKGSSILAFTELEHFTGLEGITDDAFCNCVSLVKITLPEQITSIGSSSFSGCSNLKKITIPDSVTSIGSSAFNGCSNLTSVYYNGDISDWCNIDFYNGTSNPLCNGAKLYINNTEVTEVTIPSEISEIKKYAFNGCNSLTSITIPESVTSIGEYAFYGCTGELIVNCNIPSASDYDEGAFYNSKFTKVTIGDSVTSIGDYAFYNCSSLACITIPESVTSIGRSAFYGCTGELIVNCNIPSASSSSYGAFYNSKFTKVTIGDSVTSIGKYAFYGCSSLTSVIIPESVTTIGEMAFFDCSNLTSIIIPDSVKSISLGAFLNCSSLTSITIPDSVTSIGEEAFYGCSSLTSITIPESVTTIGEQAFSRCDSMYEFKGRFATNDGRCLINNGKLIAYAPFGLTEYIIPDGVTTIGEGAFYYCSSLISITIPDSVTSIGSAAFYHCSSLTSITIPDSVTSIGGYAFSYCSSLTSVYCKATTPPTGGDYMFYNNASSRKIYVPTESVNAYKSAEYWSDYYIVGYDF